MQTVKDESQAKQTLGLTPLQLLVCTNADGDRSDRLGVHDADH